jgi:hypothetical protein
VRDNAELLRVKAKCMFAVVSTVRTVFIVFFVAHPYSAVEFVIL